MKKEKFILLLILVGFLVYFNSLFNGFVWDDEEQIVNNNLVHSIVNLPSFFQGSTFNPGGAANLGGIYYKPLMTVCFSFLYTLFGPRPFFFHLFQVIFHIVNTVLVFLLFDYTLNKGKQNPKPPGDNWLPFFLSLIFLVHPMNVEAVVYVSALQDILFFFFGMLAVLIILKNQPKPKNLLIATFFLLLSILSKETGVVFILILFCYLLFFDKEKIPTFFISTLLLTSGYFILRFAIADVGLEKFGISPISRAPFLVRLLTMPKVFFFYLSTFFYPKDLAILQHWIVGTTSWINFYLPLVVGGLFFLILIFFRARIFLFFFFWFVFSLGIHLHTFPLDMTVAERWFYLPMVGMLGMIGAVAPKLKIKNLKLKIIIVITIIGLLSIRTFIRTFDWRNGLVLYSHDIKISKDAFDLENNLGVELFRVKRVSEAKGHFEISTKLAPYWWTNWNNLGVVYERKGDLGKAATYYKKAIDNGNYYLAYENYAGILIKLNKKKEAKEFLEKEALPRLPYNQKLRQLYWYLISQEKTIKP